MSTPPWICIVERRRQLGMTQRELAADLATQSLISQVETGRVRPSSRVLDSLAARLELDADWLKSLWDAWTDGPLVREQLWLAALIADRSLLQSGLEQGGHLLVPFERCVYSAMAAAYHEDVVQADDWLTQAWTEETARQSGMVYGFKTNRYGDSLRQAAWTRVDWARAMVVEAKTREVLYTGMYRMVAANYWRSKAHERMQEAF